MPYDPKPIKQCICHDRTFEELKESGLKTVEEIADRFGCTTSCGLCKPYIARMLLTGDTEFAVDEAVGE